MSTKLSTNDKVTLHKVTRYDGTTGYDVQIDGVKVGHVHKGPRGVDWAYASSKPGVYVSGYHCRTRDAAARVLASVCGADA